MRRFVTLTFLLTLLLSTVNYAAPQYDATKSCCRIMKAKASQPARAHEQYKLTIRCDSNIKEVTNANGWYNKGTKVRISATPKDKSPDYTTENNYRYKKGYKFTKWSDNNTNNERELIMDHAFDLEADGEDTKMDEQHKSYECACGKTEHQHTKNCYQKCTGTVQRAKVPKPHQQGQCTVCKAYYTAWSPGQACTKRTDKLICYKYHYHYHTGNSTTGGGCYTREVWK